MQEEEKATRYIPVSRKEIKLRFILVMVALVIMIVVIQLKGPGGWLIMVLTVPLALIFVDMFTGVSKSELLPLVKIVLKSDIVLKPLSRGSWCASIEGIEGSEALSEDAWIALAQLVRKNQEVLNISIEDRF